MLSQVTLHKCNPDGSGGRGSVEDGGGRKSSGIDAGGRESGDGGVGIGDSSIGECCVDSDCGKS